MSRIRDTFVAPRRLFQDFHEAAPWFWVLAVSTAVAVLAAVSQPAEVFLDQVENPVNRRGRPVEITSEPSEIVFYGRLLAGLSAVAAHPLIAFALAGLLTLVFSVLAGGRPSFRQYLAVASHALLIPALGTLVVLILRLATSSPDPRPTLAWLLPVADPGSVTYGVLNGIDPFILWMLAVIAVAVDVLNPRLSATRAGLVLLGGYLLLVVVTVTAVAA